MSCPPPDTYIIYNRVLGASGRRLAMTFNGDKQPITVTPLDPSNVKQHWVIEDYDSHTQHVKPRERQDLEAGWGESIYTLPLGNYVWNITSDNGYVIKDGGRSIMWSINSATDKVSVVPIADSTGEKQRWVFHKVNTTLPN
ncbi:hypothetical protein FRC12_002882 [Ceratobasidium sp. 428]|nr:hypothetical protein FRC12_002882 [Ceratobasidium sp. 428]